MTSTASRPTVSVALCTRNGARFIVEQLRSILDQTELPSEIVVSDDDSTDATLDLVRSTLAAHDGHPIELTVLRNSPPLGVTANFEQASLACSGELIALCDQDDVWLPERLRAAVDAFVADDALTLLFSDATLIDESGEALPNTVFESIRFTRSERREVQRGEAFRTLIRRNVVTGATAVFRAELLRRAVPFPASWVHDEWLAIIAAAIGRVAFLPIPLIRYRQHSRNEIGARKPTLRDKIARITEPRVQRNARLAARADALVVRAERGDLPKSATAAIGAKASHEHSRLAYPVARYRRLLPVARAAVSGRYARFGRARYDILRDLLQPDR